MTVEPSELPPLRQLHLRDGEVSRIVPLDSLPFLIGRAPDSNLLLTQSFISRRHAEITIENGTLVLRDLGSRHGTYVNGQPATVHRLRSGDHILLGSMNGPELRFEDELSTTRRKSSSTDLLDKLQELHTDKSQLEKLEWLLRAARELNSADALDRVMASLLQATIGLAQVERGFVFLMDEAGMLQFAAGLNANGEELPDGSGASRTVMQQAVEGQDQFLITDTLTAEGVALPESIVAHQIRAVICIPLRRPRTRNAGDTARSLLGLLYLDSHFEPARFTHIDQELLNTIACEAAALVQNAQLTVVEENARKQTEELEFAARIQRALMSSQIPDPDFARVQAQSIPCSAIGGDFFDVLLKDDTLTVAVVDVSGKGISAAILASILQGMLYVQLDSRVPLAEIASAVNDYLCRKAVGKYATMVLASLRRDGHLEYINCGHVRPRVCLDHNVFTLDPGNLPVGLLPDSQFESATFELRPGSRLVLVSDGFTEAADECGDFFGDDGLNSAASCSEIPQMLDQLRIFCKGAPVTDDCTLVQIELLPQSHGQI